MSRGAALTMVVVALVALAACDKKESLCSAAGGIVVSQPCCKSAPEFPNTCAVGACGCSPQDSADRDVCQCPGSACFDGTRCVSD